MFFYAGDVFWVLLGTLGAIEDCSVDFQVVVCLKKGARNGSG